MDKKKVLVMDDEKSIGKFVKRMLEQNGDYEVYPEHESSKYLDSVKEFMPDMILMDMLMPNLNGAEAVGKLRKVEKYKNIPVLFVTGLAAGGEQEIYGGLVDGAPFYAKPVIGKPIQKKELFEGIETCLKKKKMFEEKPVCVKCKTKIGCVNDFDIKDNCLQHYDCDRMSRLSGA